MFNEFQSRWRCAVVIGLTAYPVMTTLVLLLGRAIFSKLGQAVNALLNSRF